MNIPKWIIKKLTGRYDINARDNEGRTPLHRAVTDCDTDVIEFLIDKGADVNAKDNEGRTPLHDIAKKDDTDLAQFLIDKGADVNARDNEGNTPLLVAVGKKIRAHDKFPDVLTLLVDNGADPDAKNNSGRSVSLVQISKIKTNNRDQLIGFQACKLTKTSYEKAIISPVGDIGVLHLKARDPFNPRK